MSVAVVTDSTAYLPVGLAAAEGIRVVPVQVIIGAESYPETDDPDSTRLAGALAAKQTVTTSRPSPELFSAAFADAAASGASSIVCATLSSEMSATYESALLAARTASVPVHVVDSRTAAMALGFAVLDGADAARRGATAGIVAEAIRESAARSRTIFYVDTLEFLRRGGRIGGASALVGQALQVKPILHVVDGRVAPLEKVRTASKAMARMVDLVVDAAASADVRIAIQDVNARDRADELEAAIALRLPGLAVEHTPLGAAVGAHLGPGAVAVVISPR